MDNNVGRTQVIGEFLCGQVGDLGIATGYFQLFSPTHGIFSNETTLSALLMRPLPSCTCVSLARRGQRHLWCQAQISQGASIYYNGPVTEATLTDSSLSVGRYSVREGNLPGLPKRKAHHRADSTLGLKSSNTSDLYSRMPSSNSGSDIDYHDRLYYGYPPSLLENTGIVPPISPRQLPYIPFPAHLSLIIYHLTLCIVSCCQRH